MSDGLIDRINAIAQQGQRVAADFLTRRNVVACGVGFKITGEQQTDTPSIMVSVVRKQPAEMLDPRDLIPKLVGDVPTDVVETGEIAALGINRRMALRPVRPGMSIGHYDGTTGTVSCIVQRGEDRFILSNNHVLAALNQGAPGDAILQPGLADGGTMADTVAQLAEYVPIRFLDEATPAVATAQSPQPQGCAAVIAQLVGMLTGSISEPSPSTPPPLALPENLIDAAIARPLSLTLVDPNIIDIGGPPLGFVWPQLGMRVVKSGRSTAITEARITQIDVTVNVQYGSRTARFSNQIMTSPFSQPGDSGSLVVDFERRAVGLLFSGSDQVTVVSPIRLVLDALNVALSVS